MVQGPDYDAKFSSFEKSFEYFSNSFVKEVFKGLFKGPKCCIRIGTQGPRCDPVQDESGVQLIAGFESQFLNFGGVVADPDKLFSGVVRFHNNFNYRHPRLQ